MNSELKIFTPIGMLGYGFSESIFWSTIADGIDAIIVDAGSTDGGPSKLALLHTSATSEAYKRDLGLLVKAAHLYRIPVLIGSAGGDGANAHVDITVDLIADIVSSHGYRSLNVVSIHAELDKEIVRDAFHADALRPCTAAVPPIAHSDIEDAPRIVAQMGHEPYVKAMKEHPDFDIIVGGRSYDPAPYAAFCIYRGFIDLGIAYHMGKIMECGALCAVPKTPEAMAIVRKESFDIVPLRPEARCTAFSVAAHTLYEKSRPDILPGPGGSLHLESATYEQLDDGRTVRVRGARFLAELEGKYTVKLEGARMCGYQSAFVGGFRDPILISQIDDFLDRVRAMIQEAIPHPYELEFHVYGRNGVMGSLEPETDTISKELCIIGRAKASTQAEALHVSHVALTCCKHMSYPDQVATAGNLAFPLIPTNMPMGAVAEFCIYHLLEVEDPTAFFPNHLHIAQGTGSGARYLEDVPCTPPSGYGYLGNMASVIRSKNAGPYELTFDVIFPDERMFALVKSTAILHAEAIARLYHIKPIDVLACVWWAPANAFKATIKRKIANGSFGEADTHGSAQHIPLLYLTVPIPRDS
ncbi:hypothetical protein EV356DRAFT_492711 [Viridothelium virens]|uniref:DUF1446-domain-containing protein n=1 Tax=Viridothelium virens TaxID=1048519 RepID=A0A6A6GWU6_VIRVR|nr:hypothetical protein EV356DRAFT_492711 [Viridothelium virens]